MNVTDEPLKGLLHRAQEIQEGVGPLGTSEAQLDGFVQAAVEAGFSREAVLQALRERIADEEAKFDVGNWAYAPAADGRSYLAKIMENNGGIAKVKFSAGGEATVPLKDLREFFTSPGTRVDFRLEGVWYGARIERVNKDECSVSVQCWGFTYVAPFENVRLPKDKANNGLRRNASLWTVAISMFAAGGAVGALITWLLMR